MFNKGRFNFILFNKSSDNAIQINVNDNLLLDYVDVISEREIDVKDIVIIDYIEISDLYEADHIDYLIIDIEEVAYPLVNASGNDPPIILIDETVSVVCYVNVNDSYNISIIEESTPGKSFVVSDDLTLLTTESVYHDNYFRISAYDIANISILENINMSKETHDEFNIDYNDIISINNNISLTDNLSISGQGFSSIYKIKNIVSNDCLYIDISENIAKQIYTFDNLIIDIENETYISSKWKLKLDQWYDIKLIYIKYKGAWHVLKYIYKKENDIWKSS